MCSQDQDTASPEFGPGAGPTLDTESERELPNNSDPESLENGTSLTFAFHNVCLLPVVVHDFC